MVQTSIRTNVIIELAVAVIFILSPFLLALIPSQGKAGRITASVLLVISATVLMFVAFMSDAIFGISASWTFTVALWATGFAVCLAVRMRYRSILSVVVAFLVTAFLLALHFLDVLPVKPYKRFFAAIQTRHDGPGSHGPAASRISRWRQIPVPGSSRFQNERDQFCA
jgi:hypothetical protein